MVNLLRAIADAAKAGSNPSQNLGHHISRRRLGDAECWSELITNPLREVVSIAFEAEELNLHSPQPPARDQGSPLQGLVPQKRMQVDQKANRTIIRAVFLSSLGALDAN